jgi:hypothetical protein
VKFQIPSPKIPEKHQIQHSTSCARRLETHLGVARGLFSKDARKNQVQFFRFAIKFASFRGKGRFRGGNHPKKMFCLLRFLNATADGISGNPFSRRPHLLRNSSRRCSCRSQQVDRSSDCLSGRAESSLKIARLLHRMSPSAPPGRTDVFRLQCPSGASFNNKTLLEGTE